MNLCVLLKFSTLENNIHINEKLYSDLAKKFGKIYFINISKIRFFSNFKAYKLKNKKVINNKNFKIVDINNTKEFANFFKSKKFIAINNFSTSFKDFYVHYLIKKYSIYQILIQNIGFIPGGEKFVKRKLIIKLLLFFNKTLPHKIYSLCLLLKIFRSIEIRFLSNKLLFDSLNKSKKNRLQNKFKFLQINQYKKTFLINSRSHDSFHIKKNNSISEKYITFIESDINHRDRIRDEGKSKNLDTKEYYKKINNFFSYISNIFGKKVIICVNPKYSIEKAKKNFKKFKVVKYKTQEYITKSFIVCFHDSSAILEAFYLNKNIISIQYSKMGKIYAFRNNIYHKHVPIYTCSLDAAYNYNKKYFLNKFDQAKKYYPSFQKKFLVQNMKKSGSDQIYKILKTEIFKLNVLKTKKIIKSN